MYTFGVTEIGYFTCPSDYLLQYNTLYKVKCRKNAKKQLVIFLTKNSQDIY